MKSELLTPPAPIPSRPRAFHVMAKPFGAICNLDCSYCYYLSKKEMYPVSESFRMPDPVLDQYIRQYIDSQDTEEVTFVWQGGEPTLLGQGFFEKALELQSRYGRGRKISNSLQTNGTNLTDEWCEFFHRHQFLIGVSIDGPRKVHDRHRLDKKQQPTFDSVVNAIALLKKHRVEFNTLTVVNRTNAAQPLDVYRFLKRLGSRYLQFIPIVEIDHQRSTPGRTVVTPESVEPRQFGEFLIRIFDEWVRHDVGQTFVQIFDNTLSRHMGLPSTVCAFGETCGEAMAIEHNGDVFCCDHFVYPEYRLGNIMETPLADLALSEKQQKFGRMKKDALPKYCRECRVLFACGGECPKHRFLKTHDGEEGLNYLCTAYQRFFHHTDPYMKTMAHLLHRGRPASDVMRLAN